MKNQNLDLKRYGLEAIDSNELETIEGGSWLGKLMIGIGWVVGVAMGVTLTGGLGAALFVGGILVEANDANQNNPEL